MEEKGSTYNGPPGFSVVLVPLADRTDPEGFRRLRRLLKYALRVCRLRCLSCLPADEQPAAGSADDAGENRKRAT
jgi:hypothetical protein